MRRFHAEQVQTAVHSRVRVRRLAHLEVVLVQAQVHDGMLPTERGNSHGQPGEHREIGCGRASMPMLQDNSIHHDRKLCCCPTLTPNSWTCKCKGMFKDSDRVEHIRR
jgi:hypothetical protein